MRKNLLISKITSVILAAMLAFAYTAAAVYADEPSGSGTPEDPYIVKTAEELLALGEMEEVGYVRLDADIDMSGVIGKSCIIQKLTGEFDGNGHTISNLELKSTPGTYTTTNNTGFISELSGTVKKLRLSNVTVKEGIGRNNNIGLLASVITTGESAVIDNCIAEGEIINSSKDSYINLGAFVGQMSGTISDITTLTVKNSITNVNITKGTYSTGNESSFIGGIVGIAKSYSTINVDKCAVFGEMSGSSYNNGGVGGILGAFWLGSGAELNLSDSYLGGKISGSRARGIGWNKTALTSASCSNYYYDKDKSKPSYGSLEMLGAGEDALKDENGNTGYTGLATEDIKKLTIDGFENSDDFNGYPVPVWTAAPEPVPDYTFSVKFDADNNALVSVPVKGNYYIIFAAYDDENGMISLSAEKKDFNIGENQKVTSSDEFNPAGAAKIRAMLWNSPVDLCPLTEAAEK